MHRGDCSILDVGTVWRSWRRCSWILFIGKRYSINDPVKKLSPENRSKNITAGVFFFSFFFFFFFFFLFFFGGGGDHLQ